MKKQTLHACPCCGAKTISEVGAYEICPVCKWEDDPVQSKDATYAGGANKLSLNAARAAWEKSRGNRQGKKK